MRVLRVIPITNNQGLDSLTYFSLKDIPLGSVVDITLRSKLVPALVIESADASDMKAILRGGNFALKRLNSTGYREILTPAFIKAAEYTANYHAATLGSTISSMVSNILLSCRDVAVKPKIDPFKRHTHDAYALQAGTNDRTTMYKNTARESLARGRSVIIVAPNPITAEKLYKELNNGIEDKTYILHSKISKKRLLRSIINISNSKKALLLIATPKFASINIHELGTMIIEDEANTAYNTLKRPYINSVIFLSEYAKRLRIKLILAGTVLSSKVYLSMRNGEITELAPLTTRQRSKVQVEIIDARKNKIKEDNNKQNSLKTFSPIEDALDKELSKALADSKKILILTPRNGIAPTTVCRDCNTTLTCKDCDTPVMLHKSRGGEREFLCGKCGALRDADTTCDYCNSWRLDTLGIGIELVEETLKNRYKKAKIIRIDKKTTKTEKAIRSAVVELDKADILLSTQLAIPYIDSIDICVVVSLDSMLSVPSFNIDERVFSLLLRLKDITKDKLLIQTRMPERSALTLAASGDISDFMRQELELRKTLKYPPYTIMIKITSTGSKRYIIDNFKKVMPTLRPYGPRVFREFQRLSTSRFALHALLRVIGSSWPDEDLIDILKSLQPQFEIRVNIE
jgi:primosomal protein N' (replication factor Y)